LQKSILKTVVASGYLSQQNDTTMSTTRMNFRGITTNRSNYYKRQIKMRFASKRAEVIAWVLFFGVGVAYFVACLITAMI
jgi:hypothetical protein